MWQTEAVWRRLDAKDHCFYVHFLDLDDPIVTVHQSIGEAKEQFYYERTVFLRCMANSNPPVRYSWRRGKEFLSQGSDKGVEIYEPFFTQVSRKSTPAATSRSGSKTRGLGAKSGQELFLVVPQTNWYQALRGIFWAFG